MTEDIKIENLMLFFLEDILKKEQIDLIVCCERKATAILRCLIQEIEGAKLEWPWDKVISSKASSHFKWSSFEGKRILLFDELVHHGRNLDRELKKLISLVPEGAEVITATFACWVDCENPPIYSFYNNVDMETFECLRDQIIELLQKYGSLLLDTEHIEINVRLQCGLKDFYEELSRSAENGKTFSFISGTNRTNLTVNEPDVEDYNRIENLLPKGSNLRNVVCKCRVIKRSHNVYSIIPIFYPDIKFTELDDWTSRLPAFIDTYNFRKKLDDNVYEEVFYISGLLTSVELLRGVVSSLGDLISKGKIILETPEDNLSHLKAMYPNVDINGLTKYMLGIVDESVKKKPKRPKKSTKVNNIEQSRLINLGYRTICRLALGIIDYEKKSDEYRRRFPKGSSWRELLRIIERYNSDLKPDSNEIRVIPDRLIDNGLLTTSVSKAINSKGEKWIMRTFEPEGEIVLEKIVQQLRVRGTRWLPAT
jgi:hypothetical protein